MPFAQDVAKATGGQQTWLNDCRAFTQAEVIFGAGQSQGTVVCLVLGTGIAGGVSIDGVLINNGDGQSGKFSHKPIPSTIIAAHNLPILKCGCGRFGCYETYGSGPGLERLAKQLLGCDLTSHEILPLVEAGALGSAERYRLEREDISIKTELQVLIEQKAQTELETRQIGSKIETVQQDFKTNIYQERAEVIGEISELQARLPAIRQRLKETEIHSPIDGIVNRVFFNTAGAVVGMGEIVAEIVPTGGRQNGFDCLSLRMK